MRYVLIVIGAGLTGLNLAYKLRSHDLKIGMIEARDRIGGRISTTYLDGSAIEMGATWFGDHYTALKQLIRELGLDTFPQHQDAFAYYKSLPRAPIQKVPLPSNAQPSYRLVGGTSRLIEALYANSDNVNFILNTTVQSIDASKRDDLVLSTSQGQFSGPIVVSTLPPRLFTHTIKCSPKLPQEVTTIANHTQTWMGDAIKFGVQFETAFWNDGINSGTAFGPYGPIVEMYDHTDIKNEHFVLMGFLHPKLKSHSKLDRERIDLEQLRLIYGELVNQKIKYFETVWQEEKFTTSQLARDLSPHQNHGHPIFQKIQMNNRLILAGAETSQQFGGYMKGAVRSAQNSYQKINNLLSK